MVLSSFQTEQVEGEIPNWLELPRDVTANILQRLDTIQIVTSACQVCPLWWNICKEPFLWRTIHMTNIRNSPYDLVKISQYAIQRSCGQLEDIEIECFGTDDVLKCIAENASKLRRMGLVDCSRISDKGLIEAAKHLPLLEELDISFRDISNDSLEALGQSCPLLKSLTYSCFDVEAFAIAINMPELQHLDFYAGLLTDDGLLAILDGCPRLESLFLRSFNCELSERLKKRCHEQIKILQLPIWTVRVRTLL